jgi:hypothetical protein
MFSLRGSLYTQPEELINPNEAMGSPDPGVLIDGQRELCHEFVMKNTPLRRFAREEERSLRGSNTRVFRCFVIESIALVR